MLNIPDQLAGRRVRCKNCQAVLTVPDSSTIPASPPSRPQAAKSPTVTALGYLGDKEPETDSENKNAHGESKGGLNSSGFAR